MKKLDWINTLFLTLSPVAAFVGTFYIFWTEQFYWQTGILFLVMTFITGFSITGGYHRLFAHKSYDVHPLVKIFYLFFGSAAFQNSVLRWSADHRNHHQFVDTDKDPYSIKKGFWYAHIGWIFLKRQNKEDFANVPDLAKDKWIQFQHRHIFKLGAFFGLALPALIALTWGDWFGGLFIAGWLRVVMNHHFTFFINSLCHMIGKQPYSQKDTSRDNLVLSLFTYGEGYHNFHHTFPADYRNGYRAYQWDPTKWCIWFFNKLGLAGNLRRVPEKMPDIHRLRMTESRVTQLFKNRPHLLSPEWTEKMTHVREWCEKAHARFLELKKEYAELRKQRMDDLSEQMIKVKQELRLAKEHLAERIEVWKSMCQSLSGLPST